MCRRQDDPRRRPAKLSPQLSHIKTINNKTICPACKTIRQKKQGKTAFCVLYGKNMPGALLYLAGICALLLILLSRLLLTAHGIKDLHARPEVALGVVLAQDC